MATSADIPPDRKGLLVWLFNQHGRDLHLFLARRTRSREELEDRFQDVFVKMITLNDVTDIGNYRNYLFTVATSVLADAGREAARNAFVEKNADAEEAAQRPQQHAPGFNPHEESERADLQIDWQTLTAALPEKHREVIEYKRRGETVEEIAGLVRLSPHIVRRRLQEAYAHMKSEFQRWQRKGTP